MCINKKSVFFGLFFLCILSFFSFSENVLDPLEYDTAKDHVVFLKSVIDHIIEHSPEMEMALEDIKKAKRELKTAKTYYLPHLTLQGSAGVDLLHTEDFDKNNLGADLILDWNFFRNGRLIYRVAQAKATVIEAELKKYDLELKIALETKQNIFDLLTQKAQLEIDRVELEREKKKLEKLQIQYDQGQVKQTDITRFKATLFEKEQRYLKKKTEYTFSWLTFSRHAPVEDITHVDYSLYTSDAFSKVTLDELQEFALENMPKNKINKMSVDLSKKGTRLARWRRWPQVELFAGNAFALDDLGEDNNELELRTGVIVRYPLYDGGEIKNEILLAKLQERRAQLMYDQGLDEIKDQVREDYYNVEAQQALFEAASMHFNILKKDMEQSDLEFENGLIAQFDYDELMLTLEKARLRKMNAYFDLLKAFAKLERDIGIQYLTMDIVRTTAEENNK
ncbi:TolC family protein [Chlamydiota bacterium]